MHSISFFFFLRDPNSRDPSEASVLESVDHALACCDKRGLCSRVRPVFNSMTLMKTVDWWLCHQVTLTIGWF